MPVTQSDIEQYHQHGYVIIKNILQDADFLPIEEDYTNLIDQQAKLLLNQSKISSLFDNENFARRLALISKDIQGEHLKEFRQFLFNFDVRLTRSRAMFNFFFNINLLKVVAKIIGEEITLHPTAHFRPYIPARGERQYLKIPWHQDLGSMLKDVDPKILVTWIPFVDVSPQNGCLQLIPNVKELLPHTVTNTYDFIDENCLPATKPINIIMKRGDILFMSGYIPHRGLINSSPEVRWSLDLRFLKTKVITERINPFEMVIHSVEDPKSVERDYDKWCHRWMEELKKNPMPAVT